MLTTFEKNEGLNENQVSSAAGGREQQSLDLFPESNILQEEKFHLQSALNEWYGNNEQKWRLVYRASLNNYSAAAFHEHCDCIAPLFVIALENKGEISGGFTDVAYDIESKGKGGFIKSDRAFLFTLSSSQPFFQRSKFDIVKKESAICYHKHCGPIFGADLVISNACNTNTNSYSNLPDSYDGPNAAFTTLFSDNQFSIQDYEVFTIAKE
ncbi:unnamed protein product [Diamesa serratosioi]